LSEPRIVSKKLNRIPLPRPRTARKRLDVSLGQGPQPRPGTAEKLFAASNDSFDRRLASEKGRGEHP
jgi:hypothetical protein